MIVPRTRLLLWVALIVLPFAAAGATIPGALPVAVLLILTALYTAAGIFLYRRLIGRLRNWQMLSATLDQLRKDRACLEKILA